MNPHRSFRLTRPATPVAVPDASLGFPILQQFIFLLLGAGILDGGQCFQILAYAALAYWAGFGLIMLRRHGRLTQADKILIRWGYLLLVAASSIITPLIWQLRSS